MHRYCQKSPVQSTYLVRPILWPLKNNIAQNFRGPGGLGPFRNNATGTSFTFLYTCTISLHPSPICAMDLGLVHSTWVHDCSHQIPLVLWKFNQRFSSNLILFKFETNFHDQKLGILPKYKKMVPEKLYDTRKTLTSADRFFSHFKGLGGLVANFFVMSSSSVFDQFMVFDPCAETHLDFSDPTSDPSRREDLVSHNLLLELVQYLPNTQWRDAACSSTFIADLTSNTFHPARSWIALSSHINAVPRCGLLERIFTIFDRSPSTR